MKKCTSTIRGTKCGTIIRENDFCFIDPETGVVRCKLCMKRWLENHFSKMKGYYPETREDAIELVYWTEIYGKCLGNEKLAKKRVISYLGW